ncbi:MAG: 30S ribosomal protein S21 [Bacteroidota bacterium]
MLKIIIKEGENIDRALKRYKRKVKNVKQKEEIRERKHFTKPSDKKRKQLQKAQHRTAYLRAQGHEDL